MEYHPDFVFTEGKTRSNVKSGASSSRPDPLVPMPKVKPTKDPKIEEDAVLQIMQLAIYGSMLKPKEGVEVRDSLEDVLKLSKDAGLIK